VTEPEWLVSADPDQMLTFLGERGAPDVRKLKLFGAACVRRFWSRLTDARGRRAVALADEYIEGRASRREVAEAALEALEASAEDGLDYRPSWHQRLRSFGWLAGRNRARLQIAILAYLPQSLASCVQAVPDNVVARATFLAKVAGMLDTAEAQAQASLLREIVGDPFHPGPATKADRLAGCNGSVVTLARAAYEERRLPEGTLDLARLAVLADALEDAGCADGELLGHLRGPGVHVRGCWALDLLLGQE